MANAQRTIFSDQWFRVAEQRPRLTSTSKTHRQHFRGERWQVIENPINNQFIRLNQSAWDLIGRLDGRTTIATAWQACHRQFGEQAPTQDETIHLITQLAQANVLHTDASSNVDALILSKKQYNQRKVQGQLQNFLFAKIPLVDPDKFLGRWMIVPQCLLSRLGLIGLSILIIGALITLILSDYSVFTPPDAMTTANNAALIAGLFWGTKLLHEFGHGFLCKYFGAQQRQGGGEVHTMGIMLMVLTPLPYVDTTSSSALANKWHRIAIGAGGMFVELILAAIFTFLWAMTPSDSVLHLLSYNMMIITTVTTLIFNANPLMRFDGYYMLADWLEFPNLRQQSQNYLKYLCKKYLFGKDEIDPSNSGRSILISYGIGSIFYRVFLFFLISWGVAQFNLVLGVLVGVVMGISTFIQPIWKLLGYLFTQPDLGRHRPRAISVCIVITLFMFFSITVIPLPQSVKTQGVLETKNSTTVTSLAGGIVTLLHPASSEIQPGTFLLELENEDISSQQKQLRAEERVLHLRLHRALADTKAEARVEYGVIEAELAALQARQQRLQQQEASLRFLAPGSLPISWQPAPELKGIGSRCQPGQPLGTIYSEKGWWLRVVLPSDALENWQRIDEKDITIKAGEHTITGHLKHVVAAASRILPSESLSEQAGGTVAIDPLDNRQAREPFFEMRLEVPSQERLLYEGQNLNVFISLPAQSISQQLWRTAQQMWNKRLSQ